MHTALVGTGQAPVGSIGLRSALRRMPRRTWLALMAWAGVAGRRRAPSRDELAELHEYRLVAERLREERFQAVAVGRLM
ncbi:hypothetical protein [Agromyces salentinus]|uniref:Uncharacterized protein n=1 Tax=Agromyces salentinus TaxID=269421 RepID=A0ABN2MUC8_9MICO|nr:hypothetical protein [Agromyces salentinus]